MITQFRIYGLFLMAFLLFSIGCTPIGNVTEGTLPDGAQQFNGTITHKKMEGGFYAIDGENKQKYLPINLPDNFKEDGLKVSVVILPRPDVMSMYMYGENVEILEIKRQD